MYENYTFEWQIPVRVFFSLRLIEARSQEPEYPWMPCLVFSHGIMAVSTGIQWIKTALTDNTLHNLHYNHKLMFDEGLDLAPGSIIKYTLET